MLQLPPRFVDPILMPPTGVGHIGLADRHLSSGFPPPIEVMGNRPTARLRHQRLEPNDLVPDPCRVWLGGAYATGTFSEVESIVTEAWMVW